MYKYSVIRIGNSKTIFFKNCEKFFGHSFPRIFLLDYIKTMRTKPKFIQITHAGVSESHVHDVSVTKEAPNYRMS